MMFGGKNLQIYKKSGEKKKHFNKSVCFGHTKQEGATALLLFETII